MLHATVWATSSVSRLRTWRRAQVWKLQTGSDWDHVTKFIRWQHPAMGHEARLAVSHIACFDLLFFCVRLLHCTKVSLTCTLLLLRIGKTRTSLDSTERAQLAASRHHEFHAASSIHNV